MSEADIGKTSLGVVAICRNEEVDLPGFLAHLEGWADEIVLVDDGSSDNTLAIARAAGDHVQIIEQPMCDEEGFAGQRNRGIEAATCDWLLHMDIDERAPSALQREISEIIATTTDNGLRYRRLNFFLHRPMRGGGWQGWNRPQLARRGHHRFVNAVHEECLVEGSVGQLQLAMWHLNDADYGERMRKSNQYCTLRAKALLANGRRSGPVHLTLRPAYVFLKHYLLQLGLRDGVPGLLAALHAASAEFRTWALVWDRQNAISREDIEQAANRD